MFHLLRPFQKNLLAVQTEHEKTEKAESPTLDEPWRELRWGQKQRDFQYVQEYISEYDDIKYIRVLLYGPVGAGKSSFINSVGNVLQNRITIPALNSVKTFDTSFTRKYESYKFNKGRGSSKAFYPLVFNDIMGLEDGIDRGVHADDIKLALRGHVREGYKFNPVAPLTQDDPGYNPTPSADDKVHVLVCVLSANAPQIKSSVVEKIKSIREAATELGIPQMAILTHIDEACDEIERDLRNVYKSKYLKKRMTDFSAAVGIPMNCTFPVKNYSQEIDLKDNVDTLILSALRKIIDFGDDFIESKAGENIRRFSPTEVLDEPWRELHWGQKQMDLQYVQQYIPEKDGIRYLRVLLYGSVGAGKSSFINSVSNVLRGRLTIIASASAMTSDKSFTVQYETHKFIKGRGSSKTFYPVVFNDIMGLEDGADKGVRADDIKLALEGHVKEGYKFNPVAPLNQVDSGYNPTPSADDKVHVLVCVMSANTSQMKSSVLEKMKSIREAARDLGIPQMAVMTHIDEACGITEKNLRNVYKSKHLRKKMKDFSSAVGIPMTCIFPVKNYSEEINLNEDIDTLILSALTNMINFGDDFIEKIKTEI